MRDNGREKELSFVVFFFPPAGMLTSEPTTDLLHRMAYFAPWLLWSFFLNNNDCILL